MHDVVGRQQRADAEHSATRHVLQWDAAQRADLKDGDACEAFMSTQAASGFMDHCAAVARTTRSADAIRDSQFIVDLPTLRALKKGDGEIVTEDDFADVLGQLVWSLTCERIKRGLWLCGGYPWSLTKLLPVDQAQQQAELEKFQRDCANFELLSAATDRGPVGKQIYRRHLCHKVSVKQLQKALQDPTYPSLEWACRFKALLARRARIAAPTLFIEDAIGTQKGVRTYQRGNKFSRPQRCMAMVLKK